MDYIGEIYRPPSEANSLLLQITIGCSHNKCTFCAMYKGKNFAIKPLATVFQDIEESIPYSQKIRKVFLCDGDALITKQEYLIKVLQKIKRDLPLVTRVSTYADSRSILHKSVDELQVLHSLGLQLIYQGVESGHPEVLRRINKGSTVLETLEAADKLKMTGIKHSVMFILGMGGEELSVEHAVESGKLLTKIDPAYAAALTLTVVPGTKLWQEEQAKVFSLPDRFQLLQELKLLVENTIVSKCMFAANHASNYLPIQGWLPKDKEHILSLLEKVLTEKNESFLKPEWMRGL